MLALPTSTAVSPAKHRFLDFNVFEEEWSCGIGINEKGGMNIKEFNKYVDNVSCSLFLDIKDTPGERIVLKVDSGPGCNSIDLLVKARLLAFLSSLACPAPPPSSRRQTTITVVSRA